VRILHSGKGISLQNSQGYNRECDRLHSLEIVIVRGHKRVVFQVFEVAMETRTLQRRFYDNVRMVILRGVKNSDSEALKGRFEEGGE